MREPSKAEEHLCSELTPILSGSPIGASIGELGAFREVLGALESFIPEVFREIHDEWKSESLDGVYPAIAQKTGDREIEIVGLCCLITDQTLTPIHVCLQVSSTGDAVTWLDCRLGEQSADGMRREPYRSGIVNGNMLHMLRRLDSIKWFYHVGYREGSS